MSILGFLIHVHLGLPDDKWKINEEAVVKFNERDTAETSKHPFDIAAVQAVISLFRTDLGGYTRILGELRKLGVNSISRATVRNILKEHGINPAPERDHGTWAQFLKMHADTLWACDFFSMPVCTLHGIVPYFVWFFIHLKSRGVWVSSATAHPDRRWTTQQARNFCFDHGVAITHLIRDHDSKFTASFDDVFASEQARIVLPTVCSPALNGYAERWVRSVKHECLNHFVILGERHLNHLVYEYVADTSIPR